MSAHACTHHHDRGDFLNPSSIATTTGDATRSAVVGMGSAASGRIWRVTKADQCEFTNTMSVFLEQRRMTQADEVREAGTMIAAEGTANAWCDFIAHLHGGGPLWDAKGDRGIWPRKAIRCWHKWCAAEIDSLCALLTAAAKTHRDAIDSMAARGVPTIDIVGTIINHHLFWDIPGDNSDGQLDTTQSFQRQYFSHPFLERQLQAAATAALARPDTHSPPTEETAPAAETAAQKRRAHRDKAEEAITARKQDERQNEVQGEWSVSVRQGKLRDLRIRQGPPDVEDITRPQAPTATVSHPTRAFGQVRILRPPPHQTASRYANASTLRRQSNNDATRRRLQNPRAHQRGRLC